MCTIPDKMKLFYRVFPNAIEPGNARVRIAGITAAGCTWDLIETITQYLREIRVSAQSPLAAPDKLKLTNQVIKLCEKFREYGRDGIPIPPLIVYIYRVWKSFNQDFPKPLDVWQSSEVTAAVNKELVKRAGLVSVNAATNTLRIARQAFNQNRGGRNRGRNTNRSRSRANAGGNNNSNVGNSGSRTRTRSAAPPRTPNPKHVVARIPNKVGERSICVFYNKGICRFDGANCRWPHVCCYCGKSKKPYYDCKCAQALQAMKPSSTINLLN